MTLEEERKRIDEIDDGIIELLKRRNELAKRIGSRKKSRNIPIYDERRESEIYKRLKEKAEKNEIDPKLVEELYSVILGHSKEQQK